MSQFVIDNPKELSIFNRMKIEKLKAMWLRKENKMAAATHIGSILNAQLDTAAMENLQGAELYTAIADIFMSANQFDSSRTILLKAKALYEEEQSKAHRIEVDNLLAMDFFQLKVYDSTFAYANRSLSTNSMKEEPGLVYPYFSPQEAIQSCYIIIASRLKQFQHLNHAELLDKAIPFEQLGIGLIRSVRKNLYSDADRVAYNKSVTKFYDACCLLYFYRWLNKNEGAADKFFEYVEESKFQALTNGLSANRVNSFKEVNTTLLREEKELAKQKILQNTQLVQLLSLSSNEEEIENRKNLARLQLTVLEKNMIAFSTHCEEIFPVIIF